jgi:DNA-binding response OmpR family regulator
MSTPDQTTILIIEDDDCIRRLLAMALRMTGYRVVTTATRPEADAATEQLGLENLGLVITDIHLSNNLWLCEGVDVWEDWTAARPTLPFLFLSGNARNHTLPAVRTGAVPLLSKPFAIRELLAVVRTLVERSLLTQEAGRYGAPTRQGRA